MKIQFGGNNCKNHNLWLGPHNNKCLAGGRPLLPTLLLCKGWGLGFVCPRPLAVWWGRKCPLEHGFCAPWPSGGWRIQPLKKLLKSSSCCVFLFTWSNIVSWCAADVKSLLLDVPWGEIPPPSHQLGSVWVWQNWGWKSFSHLLHSWWGFTASSGQRGLSSVPVLQRMNLDCCAAAESLVPRATKGTCPCPALSRALDGCTQAQKQLNTPGNAGKEGFWPPCCWVLAPSGLKLPCYFVSPQSEGNTLEVHTVLLLLLLLLFSARSLFCDHIPTWWIKSAGTIAPHRLFPPWFLF